MGSPHGLALAQNAPLLATPPPSWRLAFPPADAGEENAEYDSIGNEAQHRMLRHHCCADGKQNQKRPQNGPTLPGYRKAPAPAVPLCRKPVLDIVAHAQSSGFPPERRSGDGGGRDGASTDAEPCCRFLPCRVQGHRL